MAIFGTDFAGALVAKEPNYMPEQPRVMTAGTSRNAVQIDFREFLFCQFTCLGLGHGKTDRDPDYHFPRYLR